MPPSIDELSEAAREVAHAVHAAEEQPEDREKVIAAHEGVARLARDYQEHIGSVDDAQKLRIERTLGRRITDLKRLASLLPRIGAIAADSTPDRQVQGASEVGERRITGVSWRSTEPPPPPAPGAARVGGEIEAWCGPCDALTTHQIIAMIGTRPRQVLCQACGARHGYRTSPARQDKAGGPLRSQPLAPQETLAARNAEQKAEELRALGRELAAASDVRAFDPKQRYKPGDVISHAEFGRGKVETVLRSSLLVRFPQGGLKSLILV